MALSEHTIALMADNGLYLSRVARPGGNYIEAATLDVDTSSTFTVEDVDDNVIALKADNGKYLTRLSIKGINYIKPDKTNMDGFCHFRLITLLE
ncbi:MULTISPECIES: fascin domain-containing protein [unclassified Photorhabdus]|nr:MULTISPECIES: hypothetical protein [unclassified Photorhabdus]